MPVRLLRWCLPLVLLGCQEADDEFTSGRLERFCDGAIPVCSVQAACRVKNTDYLRAQFPGGQRFIVQADQYDTQLVVRLYFEKMVYPGTEFSLKLYGPGCASRETKDVLDVDLFERAGDDQIVTFVLPVKEPGDHMLQMFSDMASEYLLTIDLQAE